jgi:RimJ/RimL family protein N-acetyltransferase
MVPEPTTSSCMAERMHVPTVRTERLVLREWRAGDFAGYREMTGDPEVARFVGGVVPDGVAWRQMAMHAGHWALRGYGNWAVTTAGGEFVGRVGFWRPHGWPGLELGWALRRSAWGRGYATEAGEAALAWGWDHLDADEVVSLIHPDNGASQRLARRLGFAADGPAEIDGVTVIVHRIARGSRG